MWVEAKCLNEVNMVYNGQTCFVIISEVSSHGLTITAVVARSSVNFN